MIKINKLRLRNLDNYFLKFFLQTKINKLNNNKNTITTTTTTTNNNNNYNETSDPDILW